MNFVDCSPSGRKIWRWSSWYRWDKDSDGDVDKNNNNPLDHRKTCQWQVVHVLLSASYSTCKWRAQPWRDSFCMSAYCHTNEIVKWMHKFILILGPRSCLYYLLQAHQLRYCEPDVQVYFYSLLFGMFSTTALRTVQHRSKDETSGDGSVS